jgi:hypothetical protein
LNSPKINAGLFFLFVLISLLCAKPLPGEEFPGGDLPGEPLTEGALPGEEPLLTGDPQTEKSPDVFDAEPLLSEESGNDTLVFDAPPLIFEAAPFYGIRSFGEIFPDLSRSQRAGAMSNGLRNSFEKNGSPTLIPDPDSGIDIFTSIMKKSPSHIVEALAVVPHNGREYDMLDIYNSLRRIKNLKDPRISVNGNNINTFVETTRLESAQNRKPVSDPLPADTLPYSETMYLRLVDRYIGDLYLRGEISISLYGITYSMTNFRDVSYSIFRIMRAERFVTIIYLEPVKEGLLIYSMSGLYLPGFILSRVNLTPSMNTRITIFIGWIIDGLKVQESNRQDYVYQLLKENTPP